jgi:hypothetical protein
MNFWFDLKEFILIKSWGLRQSNNLKTIAKLGKYKMYRIDTSRDKSRDFDLVSLISWLDVKNYLIC